MKRAAVAAALAAQVLLLTACNPSVPPVTGVVVGKDYDRGTCTARRFAVAPIIVKPAPAAPKAPAKPATPKPPAVKPAPVVPKAAPCRRDEYELDVRDQHGDVHEVEVDRRTYDRTRIGDRYPKGTP